MGTGTLSRRRVMVGAAWATPAILIATGSPPAAASGPAPVSVELDAVRTHVHGHHWTVAYTLRRVDASGVSQEPLTGLILQLHLTPQNPNVRATFPAAQWTNPRQPTAVTPASATAKFVLTAAEPVATGTVVVEHASAVSSITVAGAGPLATTDGVAFPA